MPSIGQAIVASKHYRYINSICINLPAALRKLIHSSHTLDILQARVMSKTAFYSIDMRNVWRARGTSGHK
jgi:hypothetical protein